MTHDNNYEVNQDSARQERLLNSGTLGVGVVTVIQMLQFDRLDFPLWVSLACFVLSLPMLSMNVFILSLEVARREMPNKPFGVRASAYVGPIVAFVGIIAIFWHFHHLAAIFFIIISGGVSYVGIRYATEIP